VAIRAKISHIADILHLMKNNLKMAFKYTELAEDAEKKRLPFLPSVDIPEKHDSCIKTITLLKCIQGSFRLMRCNISGTQKIKDIDKNSSIYRFTINTGS
jgi:hypothetical protein